MTKLHLGAGKIRKEGYINIDTRELPSIDLVRDILRGLPYSDDTINEVFSENFMEHIPQTETIFVMNEIWRVLKPGGIAHHIIPLAGTQNDYQDPTHLSRWHINTFLYYMNGHYKNDYYDGMIKGWDIQKCEIMSTGQCLEVILKKP